MRLGEDIADAVAAVAREWAESRTDLPLTIRKTPEGAVCATSTRQRVTAKEFAAMLGMSPNTWRLRVKEELGLQPASDRMYDLETVEWARGQLRLEESRATPAERRGMAQKTVRP